MKALVVAIACAVAIGGCRRSTPKPAVVDASAVDASVTITDAGSASASVYLVAYEHELEQDTITTFHTDDGRWVVNDGALFYDPRPNGELALVGEPAAYRSLYNGHDAVGPGRRLWMTGYVVSDDHDGLLFVENAVRFGKHNVRTEKPRALTIAGREITARPLRMAWHGEAVRIRGRWLGLETPSRTLAWLDGDPKKDAPVVDHTLDAVRIAKDGTLYAFGARKTDHAKIALAWRADAPLSDPPRAIALPLGDSCAPLTSADGKVYARCGPLVERERATYVRLDGDHATPVFESMTAAKGLGIHVGADGALYGVFAKSSAIARCSDDRAPCTRYEPKPGLERASAVSPRSYLSIAAPNESEAWSVTVADVTMPTPTYAKDIFARGPDDVWITYDDRTIYHSAPARTPVRLLSHVDQLVFVDNARPIAPWVGHCNQIFVRLVGAKDVDAGKSIDAGKIADPPEIDGGHPFHWDLLEGHLGGEPVAGVGFFLEENEPVATMESAVRKVIEAFTVDPASPPFATCTLPVLGE